MLRTTLPMFFAGLLGVVAGVAVTTTLLGAERSPEASPEERVRVQSSPVIEIIRQGPTSSAAAQATRRLDAGASAVQPPEEADPQTPEERLAASEAHADAQREALDEVIRAAPRVGALESAAHRDFENRATAGADGVALRSLTCSSELCRAELAHAVHGSGHDLHRQLGATTSFSGAGFATEVPDGAGGFVTWIYSGQGGYRPAGPVMANGDEI